MVDVLDRSDSVKDVYKGGNEEDETIAHSVHCVTACPVGVKRCVSSVCGRDVRRQKYWAGNMQYPLAMKWWIPRHLSSPPYRIGFLTGFQGNTWAIQFTRELFEEAEKYGDLIAEIVVLTLTWKSQDRFLR